MYEMSLKDIIDIIRTNAGFITTVILILTTVIQIVPIKLNPWSRILSWIGNTANKDIYEHLKKIDNRLDALSKESAEQDVISLRHTIIHDATEISRLYKEDGTVENNIFMLYFDQVSSYVKLSEKYKIQDGYVLRSIRTVNMLYKQLNGVYLFTEETVNEIEQKFQRLAKED